MEQNEKSGKLLEVKDLRVSFFTPAGEVKACLLYTSRCV